MILDRLPIVTTARPMAGHRQMIDLPRYVRRASINPKKEQEQ